MNLDNWQTRLEKHFSSLAQDRASVWGDHPLFALEHGLPDVELQDLIRQIRSHISRSSPQVRHWLPWTVYATERGYQYEGDEYWQSFEEKTPGWLTYGDRYWIRECFYKFRGKFNGAKPEGRWAEHFSIICWPITHAILPEDLQRQLAQTLYEIRHSYTPALLASPDQLGHEIAAHSWRASPRFQNLAQEPLLLGQIAAALLLPEEARTQDLVHPATLLRIAKDIDRERRAREWLRSAQSAARVSLRGVGRQPDSPRAASPPSRKDYLQSLGLEPRILLRSIGPSWDVRLEIPDLAPVMRRFPSFQDTLKNSPCVVAGSSGHPLARGRLLGYGTQSVLLRRWPSTSEVLLSFEPSLPELDYMLTVECLLRPGPNWLFKIAADGLACEVYGRVVRPTCRYILLTAADSVRFDHGMKPVSVNCQGISAAYFEVPSTLEELTVQHFTEWGLRPLGQVDVQPAGLPPVGWDGEGHATWLSTDRPCVSISSNCEIREVELALSGTEVERQYIYPETVGQPVFVSLPFLSPGRHKLTILVRPADSSASPLEGIIQISVRDPRPWTNVLTSQNPFLVIADPPTPSLEQLWSGETRIRLLGPQSHRIACELLFFSNRANLAPSFRKELSPISLPLDDAGWDSYFANVRSTPGVWRAYDDAVRCEFRFNAGEYGSSCLVFEREYSALRWTLRRRAGGHTLRLHDDTGDGSTSVLRYEFDRPDVPTELDTATFCAGESIIPASGGLYVARASTLQRGLVVPPAAIRSLADLGIRPRLRDYASEEKDITNLVFLMQHWSSARVPGDPFSRGRRHDVLKALMSKLLSSVCGARWLSIEQACKADPSGLLDLKTAISRRPHEAGLGAALYQKRKEFAELSPAGRVRDFAQIAQRYLGEPGMPLPDHTGGPYAWISEFALRFSTQPGTLPGWARENLSLGLNSLLRCHPLPKAARFLALSVSVVQSTGVSEFEHPIDWGWQ